MSKAGLWNHKPPRVEKASHVGPPFIQCCISELSPPVLWCSIISSQLSAQNCHCPDCGPVVLLIAEPPLSRPWVLDRMVPSFIMHVLELTSCPPLRYVSCCCISVTKTEGKGGKLHVSSWFPKFQSTVLGTAWQSRWWQECAAPTSQQTRN